MTTAQGSRRGRSSVTCRSSDGRVLASRHIQLVCSERAQSGQDCALWVSRPLSFATR